MELDNVGMSDIIFREFILSLNIIINTACNYDTESIHNIIRCNTLGPLQLMNLAKQCKSFKV